jgi:hypothetical protein
VKLDNFWLKIAKIIILNGFMIGGVAFAYFSNVFPSANNYIFGFMALFSFLSAANADLDRYKKELEEELEKLENETDGSIGQERI